MKGKQRLGIFKLTSCDGCQASLLELESSLIRLFSLFRVDYFREFSDTPLRGLFEIAIVEGSISTQEQRREIIEIRERARTLITIGACATSGGIQALRNWASLETYKRMVYPDPAVIDCLSLSTPVSDHVYVDYELWGCPINASALSEVLASYLLGKRPNVPQFSLCMECKIRGLPCLLVSKSEPCLGPITKAGCNALCPSLGRACYGCFGPREGIQIDSLLEKFKRKGLSEKDCISLLDRMNTYAFRRQRYEKKD